MERYSDDDLPPPLVLRRVCVHMRCRETAIGASGKRCRKHHAAFMRAWRAERRVRGESTAPTSRTAPSASPEAIRARVKTSRSRAKGLLQPGPCSVCGSRETVSQAIVALWPSGAAGALLWGHRGCRQTIIEGDRERRVAQEEQAQRRAYASTLEQTLARLETLDPAVIARLCSQAGRGPIQLHAESPLYRQRLATLINRYLSVLAS